MNKKFTSISLILLIALGISGCSVGLFHPGKTQTAKHAHAFNSELPREAKILMHQGSVDLSKNDLAKAISDFSDLVKLYPDIVEAHYNLGLAYARNNQLDKAIQSWQKALALDPNNADIYYNLAQACKITKDNEKEAEYLSKYILLRPNDPQKENITKEISKLKPVTTGTSTIGRIILSDKYDAKNKITTGNKSVFSQDTKAIYSEIEINNAPKNAVLALNWYYKAPDGSKIPVNSSELNISGSKNIVLTLSKPATMWPKGDYGIAVSVNGKQEAAVSFIIQ